MSAKGKITIHQFDPTIYPRKLWVVKGGTEKDISASFSEPDGTDIYLPVEVDKETKAVTLKVLHKESGKYGVLVWIQTCINVSDAAHEATCTASCIFDDCGISMEFDGGKDEHFAYLVGFASDCINQVRTNKFKDE